MSISDVLRSRELTTSNKMKRITEFLPELPIRGSYSQKSLLDAMSMAVEAAKAQK